MYCVPNGTSSLPNKLVARGASYGALPSQLEYRVSFEFQTVDQWGMVNPGTPVTLPFPDLNNEKVTVSYKPATPADEQVLASLLPNTPITDIAQLPSSIPAYLIKVIPELKVNGVVKMTGSSVQMGSDHKTHYTIRYPDGTTRNYTSTFEAGTFHSVGIVGGAVSSDRVSSLQAQVSQLQTDIYSGNTANITNEQIVSDIFYSGTLGYFAQYYGMTRLQAQSTKVRHLLQPSIGTYGTAMNNSYVFGFPRNGSPGGLVMDIGKLVTMTTAKSGMDSERLNFVKAVGMLSSSLEHQIPEQMFSTPAAPVQAVSTMKLLSVAASQGMPVYHINAQNAAQLIPLLNLGSPLAMGEINAAIAAGKEVTVHQSQLTVGGWTGVGYALVDPVTGDGQYRLAGAVNGGETCGLNGCELCGPIAIVLGMIAMGLAVWGFSFTLFALSAVAIFLAAMADLISVISSCGDRGVELILLVILPLLMFSVLMLLAFPGINWLAASILIFTLPLLGQFLTRSSICRQ